MLRMRLIGRAVLELLRYDVQRLMRVRDLERHVGRAQATGRAAASTAAAICDAVAIATCWYWKPVLCLQRSIVTARILRAHGVPAKVVIGYRPDPFTSHAWVEADGFVLPEAQAYRERLRVLYTV